MSSSFPTTPKILFFPKARCLRQKANIRFYPVVENFTKQKMTSSKWPKTMVINKTNVKLLILG